ncbi:winged helix-turn-helix transcriptional regulator [Pelagibacterales bacterium SAG-MED13]|nr:winged helix-turn-helix transcriptional regulator [Pelagibacterales bacterium SAG-MED13]
MSSKVLIVYEYQILFEILNEIKKNLNFDIIKSNKDEFDDITLNSSNSYLVISSKKQKHLDNCLIINESPIKLEKLIDFININFLKNEYSSQSNLKIGKYKLDLNSRKIIFNNKTLNLTERETNLIFFINQKGNVSIKELQKKVWDYSVELDTHTVETHIYRLRKKMKDVFGDENFILHGSEGYSIN